MILMGNSGMYIDIDVVLIVTDLPLKVFQRFVVEVFLGLYIRLQNNGFKEVQICSNAI